MGMQNAIDAEVEFVGRHLSAVELTFAENWDQLPGPKDGRVKWVDGRFDAVPALFVAIGRLAGADTIEIRSIRIIVDPEHAP